MKIAFRHVGNALPVWSLACGSWWLLCGSSVEANPAGMTVGSGSASVVGQGPVLTVTTSDRALLNWQSFNIAPGEKTVFNQPSPTSIVWNQILDANPSKIFGSIQANGIVVLANQQGFWFGPDSVVKAAGFVATTASGPGQGFFNGGPWSLEVPPPAANIINYGQLSVASGGSLFLVAEKVENHGVLSAPDGSLGLYAGKEVLISERPDGRGLSAKVVLPAGAVDNFGRLTADAGSIALFARVVNQDGIVQADSIREVNGTIEFYASSEVHLGAHSVTEAKGTGSSASPGGAVTIRSDGVVTDDPTARVSVSGGVNGGDGGHLEVSATVFPTLQAQLEGNAASGFSQGHLLIDPDTIRISDSATGSIPSGTVNAGDPPTTLVLPPSAFANFSTINLQARKLIDIRSLWTLPDAPIGGASLTLESGSDIAFAQDAGIRAGTGWNVSLLAGSKFDGQGGITAGSGSIRGLDASVRSYSISIADQRLSLAAGKDIFLLGSQLDSTLGDISIRSLGGSVSGSSFSVSSTSGNIAIRAANNVTLSSGAIATHGGGQLTVNADSGNITATSALLSSEQGDISLSALGNISFPKTQNGTVRTTAGGNIIAEAKNGSLTTGGNNNGYQIPGLNQNLIVSPNLGGFSTAAGGNVTLTAGLDVTAYLPVSEDLKSSRIDAGTGAFGFGVDSLGHAIKGNVTVKAGRSVFGHFVVADGSGSITAGDSAGVSQTQLALTTRTGSWKVSAKNISLQEVRNAQGVFNNGGGNAAANSHYHLFDYSTGFDGMPVTSVTLIADDTVDLVGANLPRNRTDANLLPSIYPPVLNIVAGAGGVILGNPVDKSPSRVILFPSLLGDLNISSAEGGIIGYGAAGSSLVISDSGSTRWTRTESFGETDHKSDRPVHVGDHKPAVIDVGGGLDNVLFSLFKATQMKVGKDVNLTSIDWQNNNEDDVSSLIVTGDIKNRSQYTFAKLGEKDSEPDLTLLQQSCAVIDALLGYDSKSRTVILRGRLTQQQADDLKNFTIQGVDSAGQPICIPKDDFLSDAVVDTLLKGSADITGIPQLGYQVAGPGKLKVQARSIDLGVSSGIISKGALSNPAVAKASLKAADLDVSTTSGDISLFSSAIISEAGGAVGVKSGGRVVVGSDLVLPTSEGARGIYSTANSPVTVTAEGDIDVAGSRIATYDGGKLTVKSLTGDVDAGSGGLTFQKVYQVQVDPDTREVRVSSDFIPGSGILATTFTTGKATVGDICVAALQGDVIARTGGIVQAPFNGTPGQNARVDITAGSPGYIGNIDAFGSGIIGGTINLDATGDVNGVVFASGSADIKTPQNINVTLIAQGPVNVTGGTLTGTLISFSSISVDSGSINASLQANTVSTGGTQNTGASGFGAGNAAVSTATSAAADSSKKSDGDKTTDVAEDEEAKKKRPKPFLAQTKARVTVNWPGRVVPKTN